MNQDKFPPRKVPIDGGINHLPQQKTWKHKGLGWQP